MKFQQNTRRYGRIHENLQMFIDEQLFRAQHSTLSSMRLGLCTAFNIDSYKDYEGCGIGGGYGQFGILNEEEFNKAVKGDSKRIRKFTEFED